ncbi:hypothetical protein SAMN05444166_6729 [Singulisphaera sp. GP187]|uniref:hypothetical protein n=1 Tax=Singulisphaera sp. GP187 TaxID=1882752 RepID=UPI00092C79C1|nr:hypothetical protein [Singulisphaera sp. GP187]SIO61341.1 hypothetical protein SAMN05444166_6729 [Singulisphaera sp. GP187]
MTTRRPRTNFALVAFVAIAGMLSFADVASACTTTKSAPAASRACCANRPPAECGCCGKIESMPTSAEAKLGDVIVASHARLSSPPASPTCECRENEPAAPSERPAQPTHSQRTDGQSGELSAVVPLTVRPSLTLSRHRLPNESLLKSPLYLRISHLLI